MCEDRDIKIAGNKPSQSLQNNNESASVAEEFKREMEKGNIELGRKLGVCLAGEFCFARSQFESQDLKKNFSLLEIQRQQLLAFAVNVGLERYCASSVVARTAHSSFYDTLKAKSPELYKNTTDTGALSFYYLAYRRGGDVVRRIGQTFAMLCSNDGDAVYQELGEALYCWFLSVIERKTIEFKLN